jgi:hypothetical protein
MLNLRILLLIPVAGTLFAQTEQNAVPNPGEVIARAFRAGNGIVGIARPALPFPMNPQAPQSDATPTCSVPLREMKIPDDKNFTLKELKPPRDFTDRMATAPAMPACSTATK